MLIYLLINNFLTNIIYLNNKMIYTFFIISSLLIHFFIMKFVLKIPYKIILSKINNIHLQKAKIKRPMRGSNPRPPA